MSLLYLIAEKRGQDPMDPSLSLQGTDSQLQTTSWHFDNVLFNVYAAKGQFLVCNVKLLPNAIIVLG